MDDLKRKKLPGPVRAYSQVSAELTVVKGLLIGGARIVIPESMRPEMLKKIHEGHQGVSKCRERARQSIWWPGLSKHIEELVQLCPTCCKEQIQKAEPLLATPLPTLPWQKVATDIFEWEKCSYLLMVDYYSRFIDVTRLGGLSTEAVIGAVKGIFARHGVPEEVVSDNGPQFSLRTFQNFSREYGFEHITSSPLYPQSNGEAERAVRTVKSLWKKKRSIFGLADIPCNSP